VSIEADPEQVVDPAEAFERMRRQLALLSAAVEGFASRQQAIEARDYAPDIARLIERQERMVEAIKILAARPAVALTPQELAERITEAGRAARDTDREMLAAAANRQQSSADVLEDIVGHARSREAQFDALVWSAILGFVAAGILVFIMHI